MKNSHARNNEPLSQSSIKEYNSDIDGYGQDSDQGAGFDKRMNLDNDSDPIETISDDDFYNDDRATKRNDNYFEEIETYTDENDSDSDDGNHTITRKTFKPFKALEGLDQWRPNSIELLNAATRDTNTNNDANMDNDSIEEGYSDMEMDTANNISLDSIKSVSSSPPPPPPPTRRDAFNDRKGSNSASKIATAPLSSLSHPTFSLYQTKTQDTRMSSTPGFILDHINNTAASKSQLAIKKDGLASMALDCINQELSNFRGWQSSVSAEMAKHGSVAKVCVQDPQGRLCRILEMWVEHDMVFSWCVDLTEEEHQQLLTTASSTKEDLSHDLGSDDEIIQQDSDTSMSTSQPPPSLPTYAPNDDDRPYVCVFATTYWNRPRNNIISKLMATEYIAIWAPWTTIPISVDGADMYVHIITRFMMDETSG